MTASGDRDARDRAGVGWGCARLFDVTLRAADRTFLGDAVSAGPPACGRGTSRAHGTARSSRSTCAATWSPRGGCRAGAPRPLSSPARSPTFGPGTASRGATRPREPAGRSAAPATRSRSTTAASAPPIRSPQPPVTPTPKGMLDERPPATASRAASSGARSTESSWACRPATQRTSRSTRAGRSCGAASRKGPRATASSTRSVTPTTLSRPRRRARRRALPGRRSGDAGCSTAEAAAGRPDAARGAVGARRPADRAPAAAPRRAREPAGARAAARCRTPPPAACGRCCAGAPTPASRRRSCSSAGSPRKGSPRDVVVGVRGPAEFGAHAWLDGDLAPAQAGYLELVRVAP